MMLCGAVWFWPHVISWRIRESLGTRLDEHCRLMTCVCLPPTSSAELHVLKMANDTNRMRKTTVLPVYWWEILYAWDERGRKLYKCSSCCPFSWPSQWLCMRRGGQRRVISLLPTRNHHKRGTSPKTNWDILLMYAKYLVECHTVILVIKYFHGRDQLQKFNMQKIKLHGGDQWVRLCASLHSPT